MRNAGSAPSGVPCTTATPNSASAPFDGPPVVNEVLAEVFAYVHKLGTVRTGVEGRIVPK